MRGEVHFSPPLWVLSQEPCNRKINNRKTNESLLTCMPDVYMQDTQGKTSNSRNWLKHFCMPFLCTLMVSVWCLIFLYCVLISLASAADSVALAAQLITWSMPSKSSFSQAQDLCFIWTILTLLNLIKPLAVYLSWWCSLGF